ncbi:hypothetical protein BB561_006382 [Smittium simulii]|uniref:MIR domain-containing protein n=1 Tax=Smittium simulii TaxID=133385 RepID=A0A2T9Y4U3_9FUNG|nr:hypothetical protein BB561_006382 [Smittium simulii]
MFRLYAYAGLFGGNIKCCGPYLSAIQTVSPSNSNVNFLHSSKLKQSLFVSSTWFNSGAEFNVPVEIDSGWEYVTYGSNIKLANPNSASRLALTGVFYGTGSHQKAITATKDLASQSGFWVVQPPKNTVVTRGGQVSCGSTIRLLSPKENQYLHSHSSYESPLSGSQEVCGFSAESTDSNDEWLLECVEVSKKKSPQSDSKTPDHRLFWLRDYPIRLKHKETGLYLQVMPNKVFTRPIDGQIEISCAKAPTAQNGVWTANEGYYFNTARS